MEVIKIHKHPIAANTYIAYDEEKKTGVIIDPSFGVETAVDAVINEGIKIEAVYLTHGHFDHIAGVESVRKALSIPVYVHKNDADMLFSAKKNHSDFYGMEIATDPAEFVFQDGEILSAGGMECRVMHTPGHTMGSVCLIFDDVMFTGDTLFHMSIGRTDLDGGDFSEMEKSLDKLAALDVDYRVYPGHEQSTSLFYEIDNNPFLRR